MRKFLKKASHRVIVLMLLALLTGCAGSAEGAGAEAPATAVPQIEALPEENASETEEKETQQEEKPAASPAGKANDAGNDDHTPPAAPEAPDASAAKSADKPEKEAPKVDEPKADEPKPEEHEAPKPSEPEAPKPDTPEVPQPEVPAPEPPAAPEPIGPKDNGRILFIGDSRTIDMFADSDDEVSGLVADGITVYAKHGYGYSYMVDVVNRVGMDNFDTLVTWMGANDHGDFSNYGPYYEQILNAGKNLIVCTVGPTNDSCLEDEDLPYYNNDCMTGFNSGLVTWAADHGVRVIDTYNYIAANIPIDPDGVHYLPRPTTSIWNYIVSSL